MAALIVPDAEMFDTVDDSVLLDAVPNDLFDGLDSIMEEEAECAPSLTRSPSPTPQTLALPEPKASASPLLAITAPASPRLVSADSLPSMRRAAENKSKSRSTTLTPYDSLKQLVEKKKQQKQQQPGSLGLKRSLPSTTFLEKKTTAAKTAFQPAVAPLVAKPSSFLRQAFYGTRTDETPALKRRKISDTVAVVAKKQEEESNGTESALHRACCSADNDAIQRLVRENPVHASVSRELRTEKAIYNASTGKIESRLVKEPYSYPINLALKNKADSKSIVALINAAPQVLSTKDGSAQESPLHVLLKNRPQDASTADMMLLERPTVAKAMDRHSNTPLHVACRHGANMDIVRHLFIMSPEALSVANFQRQTPLDLAQRSTASSSSSSAEEIANYLWEKEAENCG